MSTKKVGTDRQGLPLVPVQQHQQARRRKRSVVQIPRWRRSVTGYVLSLPVVGVTSLGVLWLHHLFPSVPFFDGPLLLAVMVIAIIWGIGPALFAALLSTAVLAYLYFPVSASLDIPTWNALQPLAPFFLSSVLIAVVTGQRESARRRAYSAEQEEQERANELEATFEAMADGVIVYDNRGHILRTNAVARSLFALDSRPKPTFSLRLRHEHKPVLEMLDEHGQPLSEEQSPLARILNGEVLTSANAMDMRLKLEDGNEVQLNVTGAPVYTFGGRQIGAICVYRDVSERRRLERRTQDALNALLAMAQALVRIPDDSSSVRAHQATEEQSPAPVTEVARRLADLTCSILGCLRVGIMALEPETDRLRPVVIVGLSAEQEQQWRANQHQFGRLSDSPYPDLVSRLRAHEVLLLDMRQPPFLAQRNPFGVRTVVIAPMSVGEQLVGILLLDYGGVEHDYTEEETALAGAIAKLAALVIERERLLYERAKAQANELALREANLRMDEFLGMAGHELRTPLTAISGNIQLAQRQVKKSIDEDVKDAGDLASKLELIKTLLDRAERQVRLQNRLVGDLLDISRIQANKIVLKLETYDLVAIIREAVQEQSFLVPARSIRLHVPAEGTVSVVADADRIGQVVTNYLTNALKYSATDRPVEVFLAIEGQMARVSVQDEGPGLSLTEQQAIWERFYQVERITVQSGSSTGLGLGLHICQTIIEQHRGQVGVESSPGEGSTFWFILPLARK
jgi:signal transduction histidine kinase/PAS domain-containing protein